MREAGEAEAVSMPLLDHFHPPLLGHRRWETFHGLWAAALAGSLNRQLPSEHVAEFQVLPLAVRGLGCLRIELEATYMEARQRGRVG